MILVKVESNGSFRFLTNKSMSEYFSIVDLFKGTNKTLLMNIEEYSPVITDSQFTLFKALLVKGSDVSGYTYNDFETELINNFAPFKYTTSILGDKIKSRKSVSDMTSKEFNIFLEQCLEFCSQFYGFNF